MTGSERHDLSISAKGASGSASPPPGVEQPVQPRVLREGTQLPLQLRGPRR